MSSNARRLLDNEAGSLISESSVSVMIRSWRRARLSPGTESLGYPTENILEKAHKGRSTGRIPLPEGERTDAELVQKAVDIMPDELRWTFEAYHLCLIRGSRHRELPQKMRAMALGLRPTTYFRRKDSAFTFCQKSLTSWLDRNGPR